MSGESDDDTGGEDCYQVKTSRHAPITIVITNLRTTVCDVIFFLIIGFIFFAQGADT